MFCKLHKINIWIFIGCHMYCIIRIEITKFIKRLNFNKKKLLNWILFKGSCVYFYFQTAQKIIEKSNLEYWQISDAIFNSEWCSIYLICKKSISDKTNLKKSITRFFFPFQSSMYNCFKQQFFMKDRVNFFSSSLTMFN